MNQKYAFKLMLLSGVCVALLTSIKAEAQTIPRSVEPGRIVRDPSQRQIEPRQSGPEFFPEEKLDAELIDQGNAKIVELRGIIIDGSSIYEPDDITGLYSEYIGERVSFADLQNIARRVTLKYRNEGYVLSRAVLTPQSIKNGLVHIQVIEGFVSDVQVLGNFKDKSGLLLKMANKVKNVQPVNTRELERYLLLIDDLPGIRARSVLRPSNVKNASQLIITVEQDLHEGAVSVDNFGSKFLGRNRLNVVVAENSLLGRHDRTTVRGIITSQTDELRFGEFSHEQQIGSEGTRLSLRGGITRTEPGASLEVLEIEGDSETLSLNVLHPYFRSRQYNVNFLGNFSLLNSETRILGVTTAEDKVRSISGGASVDFTDKHGGVNQFDFSLTQGLDIFGATDDGIGRSRSNGKHNFFRANASAFRVQEIAYDWSLYLSASGQYTPDTLLASEEFGIGGRAYGRAYDGGEIAGDKGLAGVTELRYGHPVEHRYLRSFQNYAFYDIGKVWNDDILVGEAKQNSLASAGLGIRLNLVNKISAQLEVAQPLTRDIGSEGDDNPRVFFNLLKRW